MQVAMRHRCTWEAQGPTWRPVHVGQSDQREGVARHLDHKAGSRGLGDQKAHGAEVWPDLTCISIDHSDCCF